MNAKIEPITIKQRSGFLGGTDAAVIAGCHPYKTARELYHEKRGELESPDISDKEAVIWGNVLEDVIAQEYSRRTGNKVRRVNSKLTHPDFDFIGGHIDRDIVGIPRALEVKTASLYLASQWGPSGSDEVPEHYLLQCQHYMGLLPKVEMFDLVVLLGGQDLRLYHIPRDDGLIENLFSLEAEFWRDVQAANEPDFDFEHKSTADLIARLYPGTSGAVITLPDEALHWQKVMADAQEQAKQYGAIVDGAKTHLKALCGDAAVALIPGADGAGFTRKVVKRKGYTVDDAEYVDFRFSKKPKGVQ